MYVSLNVLTDKHFFLQQNAHSNDMNIKSVSRTACKTTNSVLKGKQKHHDTPNV
jgi:hypothetical protein